jgi:alpha,alpha-trehalase
MDAYMPERDLGELFIDVQLARIFFDSKTFVDCIPLQPPANIVALYRIQKSLIGFSLQDFVYQHFEIPSSVHIDVKGTATDMFSHLRNHWSQLVKEANSTSAYSTLINLPHPYVIPGGRFREMFYWDSYFTIIGLLESNEDKLALGMIQNFDYLIKSYGYIPNGNRTYFLSRSQPPFFAEMLKIYSVKHGMEPVIEFLPSLEKEYHFWMKDNSLVNDQNTVSGKSVWLGDNVLNRYTGAIPSPRPEAYNKEYIWAQALPETKRANFYLNLQAACESGWDFSSRWFADGNNKSTIACENLIPVCLNSLLYNCELQLAEMYKYIKDNATASKYEQFANSRKLAIHSYCWSEEQGVFTDYQFINGEHNPVISLATVYPLFVGIATQTQANKIATVLEAHFLREGGLITTLNTSGEQWDAPNGWAPLQWLAVIGLSQYGHAILATEIATRWLQVNRAVYLSDGKMMEKYNVIHPQLPGGGGNYENQDGFGWTNGVALALNAWLERKKTQ